jgi:exodeoxyribonuclease VII small subunit
VTVASRKKGKGASAGEIPPETRFEEALEKLEEVVRELEEGEVDLERGLRLFDEGVGLSRFCLHKLEEAERKVEMLLREGEELRRVPLEADDLETGDD